jgi:endoglucanase
MKFFGVLACLPVVSAVIKGYNFYGLETPRKDFVCSWANPISYYIDKLYDLGFNAIRLPFSLEYVREGNFARMDDFFRAVSKHPDIRVVMDLHRVFASHQGDVPTEGGTTLHQFIAGWNLILQRYHQNPQVVAVDIYNEYQGTDEKYWNSIAKQIVQGIEDKFPNRFVYYVGGTRWGGNLHGISLEDLPFAHRINYTIHKYHFSGDPSEWDWSFGEYKHKVNVGEWGFFSEKPEQVEWAKRFIAWLISKGIRDNFFWTIAHSGDTNGIWRDDCQNIDWQKYDIIKSLSQHNQIRRGV